MAALTVEPDDEELDFVSLLAPCWVASLSLSRPSFALPRGALLAGVVVVFVLLAAVLAGVLAGVLVEPPDVRGFAAGFFFLGELGLSGPQAGARLFERDFGARRVERGEQLARRDVLALGHVDVGDRSARLEAEVELAGGLQVAAARYGRLDDSQRGLGGSRRGGLASGGGADDEDGGRDRAYAQQAQEVVEPGASAAFDRHCAVDLGCGV